MIHFVLLSTCLAVAGPSQFGSSSLQGETSPEGTATIAALGLSAGALREASSRLLFDEPGDGNTWARSARWKASFGPGGVTYIPFFGSDAPRNYPVTLDLTRATLGDEELLLADRERSRSGSTVTLDRGALREVYHVDAETVEQTFVLDDLPHGVAAGRELVLKLDVKTELAPSQAEDGSLTFAGEYGEVRYGQAVAIDGAGKRLPLVQVLDAGVLDIRVPASFMAAATYPIIIDPILTTFSFGSTPRDVVDVDVAYDGTNTTYQIVFSERQSALDMDIIAINYNAALGILLNPSVIDSTGSFWSNPANASAFHEQQFLCVGLRGFLVGTREVWGRTRDAGSNQAGPQFQISGPGAETADVGGKGNDVNSAYDYMVVWQEADTLNADFDIVAQAVEGGSTLTGGRIIIDGDVGDFDTNPRISKSSGRPNTTNANNEYMVVWEREVGTDNRNLRSQVMEYTGVLTGHSQFNSYTFSDSINPSVSVVSANGLIPERHWVIAFERRVGSDYDIFTVVAQDGFADNARSIQNMQNLDLDRDHRDPVIAFDSEDYLIVYQTEAPSGDRSVHLTAVNVLRDGPELRTGIPELRRESLALSEDAPASFGIASHYDGGGPFASSEPGDAVAIWTVRDGGSDDFDPAGAVVAEVSLRVTGSQYCAAAANSTGVPGFIRAVGSNWSAGSSLLLFASDIPSNSFGHFIVSNQAGFVMNPGGSEGNLCLQGAVGRFNRPGEVMNSGPDGTFALSVDSGDLPSPNGTVSVQPGETWYFQCWVRDFGPSSNFTSGVEVTFD